ncbi:stage III sporulation protein AC [Desulfohalotomaculum tongense]|uniref:stage III sporulation protein AC n=1 Tax=Desulforadius tongensis TaxID=1216062 RepID=UPI00195A7D4B|nr:stage III sporulation protein AC [Desulforadius tongensis]MBM7855481.1 stage III sporulation protein AC [Desulforadius tongensis]
MGSIDIIFRIAGIGILVAALHTVLKNAGKEEYAHWVTVGGVVVILFWVIDFLGAFFAEVKSVFNLF